jgi:dTDP-4-amino-4,6-dideoxygalactose transaminase
MTEKIQLSKPFVTSSERDIINKVIKSHFWASGSGVGYVKKFENNLNKFTDAKTCLAVNSGTAALELSLSLFNLKNKEVFVPSLTFVSTVHAILQNGGIPIFIDIDPITLSMNIDEIKKKISKKTEAIIAVHFGGMPINLKKLKKISLEYKIPIIEDAAHACGSKYDNKKIGSHSDLICFSFHPVKNLAMPSGGAICINKNSSKFKKTLNSKRWCGITNRKNYYYDVDKMGWNYYMNEISASIGLVQLKKLDKLNKIRLKIAKQYFKELNVEFKMPFSKNCSYHLYWIRVKKRKEFINKMKLKGIETGIHYNPVHLMTFYKKYGRRLPITEKISKEIVSIPIHPNLTQNDVDRVVTSINNII